MALPLSGQLSLSDIAGAVVASTPYSLRSMSATAGFSTPDSVSEFYGYSGGHPISTGLVLHFDISNPSSYPGSGTTVTNLYGGNNMTLTNGPTYASGPPSSILFDGTNDYGIMASYTAVQLGMNVSYETIIRVGTGGLNNGNFYSKNVNNGLRMRVQSGGSVWMYNIGNTVTTSGVTLLVNTNYHIVCVGSSSGLRIYVNGILRASNSTAFNPYPGTAGIFFGTSNGSSEFFRGNIYLGRQYNTALTQTNVTDAYNYYKTKYSLP